MVDLAKEVLTTEDIKNMTSEDIEKVIDFIKSNEKLIGDNDKGVESTLNRGLRDFIELFKKTTSMISGELTTMKVVDFLTQERVNELMNVVPLETCTTED